MSLGKLMAMVPALQRLDPETVDLLVAFVQKAVQQPDANEFIKRACRNALDDDQPTGQEIEVKIE